ncbi:hypothetical protein GW17_00042922 [Ensete ventricosum]|nr:hypothetical protein GW17_00042922 [Ensete ventricosum]
MHRWNHTCRPSQHYPLLSPTSPIPDPLKNPLWLRSSGTPQSPTIATAGGPEGNGREIRRFRPIAVN